MTVVVHEIPIVTRHVADRCSQAYCFNLVIWLILIIIPYIIGYATHGFWLKESWYRELPDVKFKHQMVLFFEGDETGTDYLWTTSTELNELAGDKLYPVQMICHESDSDFDGLAESVDLQVTIPLTEGQNVVSVKALLAFEYQISDRVELLMDSLGYIDFQSSIPGSELFMRADLAMVQRNPLGDGTQRTVYDGELLSWNSIKTYNDLKFSTIVDSYFQRNETTRLENIYTIWTPGNDAALEGDVFSLKAEIRYPSQIIYYIPDFWQTVKFAWVQYLPIFFIFFWISRWGKNFVFKNRIFETILVTPEAKTK